MVAEYHCLFATSWYIISCPMYRSCEGKCSFLWTVCSFSGCKPSWCLAALDMDRSDLAHLFCRICISDCKLPLRGVLQYIIKHLNRSFSSSFALLNKFFTIYTYFSASPFDCGLVGWACDMIDMVCIHYTGKSICSVTGSIVRNWSFWPTIFIKYLLAMVWNMLSSHGG